MRKIKKKGFVYPSFLASWWRKNLPLIKKRSRFLLYFIRGQDELI